MIHFQLHTVDQVALWGDAPGSIHWFGLTDGLYWLRFGETTLFEYSDTLLSHWKSEVRYVDYHIIRLVEDLSELFAAIAEPMPEHFYERVKTPEAIHQFFDQIDQWRDDNSKSDEWDEIDERHSEMGIWVWDRRLDTGYLNYQPKIYFWRVADKLHLTWITDAMTEECIPVWSAKNGGYSMDYQEFVAQVEDFGHRFFDAMALQVQNAIAKDWGEVEIDKPALLEEQKTRKETFAQYLALLKNSPHKTDWNKLENLIRPALEKP
jgi:hypothetical protein